MRQPEDHSALYFAIIVATVALLIWIWNFAPCSIYGATRSGDVPARCLTNFVR